MVEAERLLVTVEAVGDDAASRGIRKVGRSAIRSSSDVSFLGERLDNAGRDAIVLAGNLQGLRLALDETSDEFNEVTRSASVASGAMNAHAGSTLTAAAAHYTMHDAIIAGAVPALIVLGSTLGPLVGVVGALAAGVLSLAGAFSAVLGAGVLAWGDKLASQKQRRLNQVEAEIERLEALRETEDGLTDAQQARLEQLQQEAGQLEAQTTIVGALTARMQELGQELANIIIPWGRQFIPLIESAVAALPTLVQRMLDAAGSMQPFTQELRRLGQSAMTVIPNVIGWMADLARESLPVWRRFTEWAGERVPDALVWFRSVVEATWDPIKSLTVVFIDTLRVFTEFGVVATQVVVPILNSILEGFQDLLRWVMDLPPNIRDLVIALGALAPVFTVAFVGAAELARILKGLSTTITTTGGVVARITPAFSTLVRVFGAVAAAAATLYAAYRSNFAGIRDATDRVIAVIDEELQATVKSARDNLGPMFADISRAVAALELDIEGSIGHIVSAIETVLVAGIRAAGAAIREDLRRTRDAWAFLTTDIPNTIAYAVAFATDRWTLLTTTVRDTTAHTVAFATDRWTLLTTTVRDTTAHTVAFATDRWTLLTTTVRDTTAHTVAFATARWRVLTTFISDTIARAVAFATDRWNLLTTYIPDTIARAVAFATDRWNLLTTTVRATADRIVAFIQTWGPRVVKAIVGPFVIAGREVHSALQTLYATGVQPVLDRINRSWNRHGAEIIADTRAIWTTITTAVNTTLTTLRTIIGGFALWALGRWTALWTPIEQKVSDTWAAIRMTVSVVTGAMRTTILEFAQWALSKWDALWSTTEQKATDSSAAVSSTTSLLTGTLRTIIGEFALWALGKWNTLWAAVEQEVSETWAAIRMTVSVVTTAIQGRITEFATSVRSIWTVLWSAAERTAAETWTAIRDRIDLTIATLRTSITLFTTWLRDEWAAIWGWAEHRIDQARLAITLIVREMTERIATTLLVFARAKEQLWDDLLTFMETSADATWQALLGLWEAFSDALLTGLNVLTDLFREQWSEAWEKVMAFFTRTADGILSYTRTWGRKLTGAIQRILDTIWQAFVDFGNALIWGSLIPRMLSDVLSAVRNLTDDMARAGRALIQAVVNGIRSKLRAVKNAAGDVARAIRRRLPGSDAEAGPLSDLTDSAQVISETVAAEMTGQVRVVERASDELARAARPEAPATPSRGTTRTRTDYNDITINIDARDGTHAKEIEYIVSRELDSLNIGQQ